MMCIPNIKSTLNIEMLQLQSGSHKLSVPQQQQNLFVNKRGNKETSASSDVPDLLRLVNMAVDSLD